MSNAQTSPTSMLPRFTPEQYEQICKMLEQHNQPMASANMSGTCSAIVVNSGPPEWIIDKGATNHMTSNIDLQNKGTIFETLKSKKVALPNGDVSIVTHT